MNVCCVAVVVKDSISPLNINDSKTEFIVFRSPQLRCDLSSLSVNVGECW